MRISQIRGQTDLIGEIIVDNFAGGGGASETCRKRRGEGYGACEEEGKG